MGAKMRTSPETTFSTAYIYALHVLVILLFILSITMYHVLVSQVVKNSDRISILSGYSNKKELDITGFMDIMKRIHATGLGPTHYARSPLHSHSQHLAPALNQPTIHASRPTVQGNHPTQAPPIEIPSPVAPPTVTLLPPENCTYDEWICEHRDRKFLYPKTHDTCHNLLINGQWSNFSTNFVTLDEYHRVNKHPFSHQKGCCFGHLNYTGTWSSTDGCAIHRFGPEDLQQCLSNNTNVLLTGDSRARQLSLVLGKVFNSERWLEDAKGKTPPLKHNHGQIKFSWNPGRIETDVWHITNFVENNTKTIEASGAPMPKMLVIIDEHMLHPLGGKATKPCWEPDANPKECIRDGLLKYELDPTHLKEIATLVVENPTLHVMYLACAYKADGGYQKVQMIDAYNELLREAIDLTAATHNIKNRLQFMQTAHSIPMAPPSYDNIVLAEDSTHYAKKYINQPIVGAHMALADVILNVFCQGNHIGRKTACCY